MISANVTFLKDLKPIGNMSTNLEVCPKLEQKPKFDSLFEGFVDTSPNKKLNFLGLSL